MSDKEIENIVLDGEGKKKKSKKEPKSDIKIRKTKSGRKYVKIDGTKLFLTTLLKKVNKKRKKEKKKQYKTIDKRNIQTALFDILFKKKKPEKVVIGKTLKVKGKRTKTGVRKVKNIISRKKAEKEAKARQEAKEKLKQEEIQKQMTNFIMKSLRKENPKLERPDLDKDKPEDYAEKIYNLNKATEKEIHQKQKEIAKLEQKEIPPPPKKDTPEEKKEKIDNIVKEIEDVQEEFADIFGLTKPEVILDEGKTADELADEIKEIVKEKIEETPITTSIKKRVKLNVMEGGMLTDREDALSNTEIDNIMEKYKNYLGTFPKDWLYKAVPMIKEKSNCSMIVNLDDHNQGGSHWVAIYVEARPNKKKSIEYYDSFARPPPKIILDEMKRMIKQADAGEYMKLKYNGKKQQNVNSVSCGFMCINFILDRMRGKSFKQATNYKIEDNEDRAEDTYKKFEYVMI